MFLSIEINNQLKYKLLSVLLVDIVRYVFNYIYIYIHAASRYDNV